MNFIKKFIGTTTTDEVALIPSGKLYLTRSKQSPKGAIECLYNDAFASIKRRPAHTTINCVSPKFTKRAKLISIDLMIQKRSMMGRSWHLQTIPDANLKTSGFSPLPMN